MPNQLFVADIGGLQPLFDRKKIQQPYVVEGQNFIMDSDGPISGLGRTLSSYKGISTLGNIQEFKISETFESLIINNEGVFRYDTDTEKLVLLYLFSSLVTSEFPWSMAAVGNKFYFARKNSLLIEYDVTNDSWQSLSGGSIPPDIYACCESEGRLILQNTLGSYWSAIGDGQDFTASTSTGAGAQAYTKLGLINPKPLGVKKVPDGFLSFVSSGIMKSQAIISVNPYRHVILSTKHIPVNPYCLAISDSDSIIMLNKNGLFETTGDQPKPWQQAIGEYLHTKVLPSLDLKNNQNNIQIQFDTDRSWCVISIAENQQDYIYTKAYILNSKIDKWGVLNGGFVAFLNLHTLATTHEGFDFSLVGTDGSIYRFDSSIGIEEIPDLIDGYSYWNFYEEIAGRINDDVLILTTKGQFATSSKLDFSVNGLYYRYSQLQSFIDPEDLSAAEKAAELSGSTIIFKSHTTFSAGITDIVTKIQDPIYGTLNSYVHIGPLRLTNEQDMDRYSYINNLSVGTLKGGVGDTFEDWNSETQYPVTVSEDWLTLSGEEDWGAGLGASSVSSVNYDLNLIATLDAETPIEDYTPVVTKLHSSTATDFYACETMGLYHLINVSALEVTQNFHIKTLDLSFNIGGRLL